MSSDPEERQSAFRTWNGVASHELRAGVNIHAIGGEQVMMCRVTYDPGTTVERHNHEHSEQIIAMLDGEMTMTIGDETRHLSVGDVSVANRGVYHELYSEGGCTFMEALSPVPRDHVPDAARDLVLGPQGDRLHVER